MKAFCYASGEIDFARSVPEGALMVGEGKSSELRNIISANARHAYDGKTLLVPGIPEADTVEDALSGYKSFRELVAMRLRGERGFPAIRSAAK